jgi:hypothetical protein
MMNNKAEVILEDVSQIAAKINGIDPVYAVFSFNGFVYRTNGVTVQGKDGSKWNTTHSLNVVLAAREVWNAR